MSDLAEQYQSWAQRVATSLKSAAQDVLSALRLVQEGTDLRREQDLHVTALADMPRQELLALLYRLQNVTSQRLARLEDDAAERTALVEYTEKLLEAEQTHLTLLLTRPDVSAAARAFALECLRGDLQWLATLVARIDGQAPPEPNLAAKLRMDKLSELLQGKGRDVRQDRAQLREQWQALETTLLEREVREETGRDPKDGSPSEQWTRRFALSHLQTEIGTLVRAEESSHAPDAAPRRWQQQVAEYRERLAGAAEESLACMPSEESAQQWEEILAATNAEVNEISTFVEEISLARAIDTRQLLHDDLDRLAVASCRQTESASEKTEPGHQLQRIKRRFGRLEKSARSELQEKRLAQRMEAIFGRRFVSFLESLVLVLILVIAGLIAAEWIVDEMGKLTPAVQAFFAWADLAICTVFLFEFFLKLGLTEPVSSQAAPFLSTWPWLQGKWLYFKQPRNCIVGFVAAIPFGFIVHHLTIVPLDNVIAEDVALARLGRLLRLPRLARYIRVARPLIRVWRLFFFAMRGCDQLMRRYASVFNRNIVLFEPVAAEDPEHRSRHLLVTLRDHFDRRAPETWQRLDVEDRLANARLALADLQTRITELPAVSDGRVAVPEPSSSAIPAEAVISRFIEMTPEQLVEQMGEPFVQSIHRHLRLFDIALIRRLPGIRCLVASRAQGAAEAAALATNYLGHVLQTILGVIYYFADLQGTISPPIFLDRLGRTLVTATSRPAKRLLMLGVGVGLLYLLVVVLYGSASSPVASEAVATATPAASVETVAAPTAVVPAPSRHPWLVRTFRALYNLLGIPVIVVGTLCAALWILGIWLRKVANRAAELCERIVEAQFAAQTKAVKHGHHSADMRFLADRVIVPELELRASDNRDAGQALGRQTVLDQYDSSLDELMARDSELAFLRNVHLLYQDYLDGSLFHRSDTKTTVQLLGNLALTNLRQSNLSHALRESKRLESLDLGRTGTVFGGPYLWFNYIMQMITQETAKLLLDYNRHAIPLQRLACATRHTREEYRCWLSTRLGIAPTQVQLPEPVGRFGDADVPESGKRHRHAEELFETVEFTAVDFLTADPRRDAELAEKFGPQLAELVCRHRCENVRRAFRSMPLQQVPLEQRTVNFYTLYEDYMAGGRVLLLPFRLAWLVVKLVWLAVRKVIHLVLDIVQLRVSDDLQGHYDSYQVARRKVHRMRKPVFMESLWLRARFDVEYLGLPLPMVSLSAGSDSLLETDLTFIGANRRERLAAEQLRRQQRQRVRWIGQWLDRLGWDFHSLPGYLSEEFPYLADRSAEVIRAMVTAFVVGHDDVDVLAASIEGLEKVLAHAADQGSDLRELPVGLPASVDRRLPRWYSPCGPKRALADLFSMTGFSTYDRSQRQRIEQCLRYHRRVIGGWLDVLLTQGGSDPVEVLRHRLRGVIRRTDLWSDEIIALRTIQTLTMLDVYHYCEMVWKLGDYDQLHPDGFTDTLPTPVGAGL